MTRPIVDISYNHELNIGKHRIAFDVFPHSVPFFGMTARLTLGMLGVMVTVREHGLRCTKGAGGVEFAVMWSTQSLFGTKRHQKRWTLELPIAAWHTKLSYKLGRLTARMSGREVIFN